MFGYNFSRKSYTLIPSLFTRTTALKSSSQLWIVQFSQLCVLSLHVKKPFIEMNFSGFSPRTPYILQTLLLLATKTLKCSRILMVVNLKVRKFEGLFLRRWITNKPTSINWFRSISKQLLFEYKIAQRCRESFFL